jgi:hypothetical protein
VSLLATLAVVAAVAMAWPDDGEPAPIGTSTPTTLMTADVAAQLGGPQVSPSGAVGTPESTVPAADLFGDGPSAAVQEVLAAAGQPDRLIEVTLYPSYLFVAYVDPRQPDRIDRRMWREGAVGDADRNPIDDHVDASTTPKLFGVADLQLDRIPALIADAPSHYDEPVTVTHVIVDRFLPFDSRVLVRVYASPPGNPAGGGYVTYTTDGTFVKVCC